MGIISVLLYNLENDKGAKIVKLCTSLSIRAIHVKQEEYFMPIELLLEKRRSEDSDLADKSSASGDGSAADEALQQAENAGFEPQEDTFDEEMLVMCGFNRRLLDIFLREYKKRHIAPVSLKAVLTEHNRAWSSNVLYCELCRERTAISERLKK